MHGFVVYTEEGRGVAKRVAYWNRKAQAWQADKDSACVYPTPRGAARRMKQALESRRRALDFGEFAIGFAPV